MAKLNALERELAAMRMQIAPTTDVILGENPADRQCCSINSMPTSCEDLKKIGNVFSGFYTVKGNKTLDSVYCDFTKPVGSAGMFKNYIILYYSFNPPTKFEISTILYIRISGFDWNH